jgi:hypothetical protein
LPNTDRRALAGPVYCRSGRGSAAGVLGGDLTLFTLCDLWDAAFRHQTGAFRLETTEMNGQHTDYVPRNINRTGQN